VNTKKENMLKDNVRDVCRRLGTEGRRKTLLEMLGASAELRVQDDQCNIVVPATKPGPIICLTAHYDVYPRSYGYNDNGSGIAVLLSLIGRVPENVEIVFTDNEEIGYLGADAYCRNTLRTREITLNINVDVVGIPGHLFHARYGWGGKAPTDCWEVDRLPFSDSFAFRNHRVPSVIVISGPSNSLDASGNVDMSNLLGGIWQYQHCGPLDTPGGLDHLSEDMMIRARDFVLDAIEQENTKETHEPSLAAIA
jgi:hypothetical protein